MLGSLLTTDLNDTSNQDVHDRALLYYRLLNAPGGNGVATTRALFDRTALPVSVSGFSEGVDSELVASVMSEFNTLAVVYGKPSIQFIEEPYQKNLRKYEAGNDDTAEDRLDTLRQSLDAGRPPLGTISQPPEAGGDLLDLMGGGGGGSGGDASSALDILGLSDSGAGSSTRASSHPPSSDADPLGLMDWGGSPPTHAQPPSSSSTTTTPGPVIDPTVFQELWAAYEHGYELSLTLPSQKAMPPPEVIEAALAGINAPLVASGPAENGYKFFFYAHALATGTDLYVIQLDLQPGLMGTTALALVKPIGQAAAGVQAFLTLLTDTFNAL
jgi:hypothetical protein